MMYKVMSNWNAWRLIRLILSLVFVVYGIIQTDYYLIAGGIFIMYQAVFNTGCCANGNCEVNYRELKNK